MALTQMGPSCSQRAQQLAGGQSAVLEVAEQEGADGTPTAGWGCPWPPTTWPHRAPSGGAQHPVLLQPSKAGPPQPMLGQSLGSGGAVGGSLRRRSPRPCRAAGPVLRGIGTKRCRSCQDALYQITLPFSLPWHICSYCGRLPSTRVVVMKSLYLHKVIVHVIKKKSYIDKCQTYPLSWLNNS